MRQATGRACPCFRRCWARGPDSIRRCAAHRAAPGENRGRAAGCPARSGAKIAADLGALRVPPDRVGRHHGVAGPLVHRIGQRQRHAARRGFDAVRLADVLHTLVIAANPRPHLVLIGPGGALSSMSMTRWLSPSAISASASQAPRRSPRRRPCRTTCKTGRHARRSAPAALPCAGAAAHRPTMLSRSRAGSWNTSGYLCLTVAHGLPFSRLCGRGELRPSRSSLVETDNLRICPRLLLRHCGREHLGVMGRDGGWIRTSLASWEIGRSFRFAGTVLLPYLLMKGLALRTQPLCLPPSYPSLSRS